MTILRSPEFKVGLLVLVVAGLVSVMSMQVSEDPGYLGKSKGVWFRLNDASGLVRNSAVKMAGIDVGMIRSIQLDQGKARIDLTVRPDLPLTTSARVMIKASGILGDRYIDLLAGDPNDPPLKEDSEILVSNSQASLDNLVNQAGDVVTDIGVFANRLREATDEKSDPTNMLGRIVQNVEKITAGLANLTETRGEKLGEIVDQLHGITSSLNELVNDQESGGIKAAWQGAVASLGNIEKTVNNIEEITDKVNRGEGTLGRLINDETTIEEINTAVSGVNDFLDTSSQIETSVDFHSNYLTQVDSTKSFLGVRIQPGLDRYYELQVVDDPVGVTEQTETTVTSGATTTTESRVTTFRNRVKFSALFAKNFYSLTVKGGLIENVVGFGLDYLAFRRRLQFSLELFDFADTRLRTTARYSFYPGLYLMAGADDMLDAVNQSAFVGAGIFLTNDDLKVLMSKVSF